MIGTGTILKKPGVRRPVAGAQRVHNSYVHTQHKLNTEDHYHKKCGTAVNQIQSSSLVVCTKLFEWETEGYRWIIDWELYTVIK